MKLLNSRSKRLQTLLMQICFILLVLPLLVLLFMGSPGGGLPDRTRRATASTGNSRPQAGPATVAKVGEPPELTKARSRAKALTEI